MGRLASALCAALQEPERRRYGCKALCEALRLENEGQAGVQVLAAQVSRLGGGYDEGMPTSSGGLTLLLSENTPLFVLTAWFVTAVALRRRPLPEQQWSVGELPTLDEGQCVLRAPSVPKMPPAQGFVALFQAHEQKLIDLLWLVCPTLILMVLSRPPQGSSRPLGLYGWVVASCVIRVMVVRAQEKAQLQARLTPQAWGGSWVVASAQGLHFYPPLPTSPRDPPRPRQGFLTDQVDLLGYSRIYFPGALPDTPRLSVPVPGPVSFLFWTEIREVFVDTKVRVQLWPSAMQRSSDRHVILPLEGMDVAALSGYTQVWAPGQFVPFLPDNRRNNGLSALFRRQASLPSAHDLVQPSVDTDQPRSEGRATGRHADPQP